MRSLLLGLMPLQYLYPYKSPPPSWYHNITRLRNETGRVLRLGGVGRGMHGDTVSCVVRRGECGWRGRIDKGV